MASTDNSRSSTATSPDSYIGSLISLTSKSEIRYEGVLFNINTEESSIGLRNVRSFGTEGRKKDGPQVPPSDKIYEYILFRGTDIKDLQVKSSPPVQNPAPIHNDPAIIQSHYPQSTISSTNLPSSTVSTADPGSQTSVGPTRPAFQGSLPLYRPGASLGQWGSSAAPTSNVGISMPMYWQGYYGSTNGLPPQQQPMLQPPQQQPMLQPPQQQPMLQPSQQQPMLQPPQQQPMLQPPQQQPMLQPPQLQPPPGLPIPPTLQQYPTMNMSLPPPASNLAGSQLSENSPLQPPFGVTTTLNLHSSVLPAQSNVGSNSSTSLNPERASTLTLPSAAPSSGLPLVSPLSNSVNKTDLSLHDKPKTIPDPIIPFKGMSDSASSAIGTSSILKDGMLPSLVTPGQLIPTGTLTASSSMSSQTAQKDVEVVHMSSLESMPAPAAAVSVQVLPTVSALASPPLLAQAPPQPRKAEGQEPILPSPSDQKLHGAPMHGYHSYRGRERGRGNELSRSATSYTEEFDFIAMNEKFNKDEVWGHLGKSNRAQEDADDLQYDDSVGSSKPEAKPLYVKDDFFDSLSCDALDGRSRNGRGRFSEQMRRDTETFGNFPRHRGGRGGGRGPFYSGRGRGSYYGRGYGYSGYGGYGGYGGRGRGYDMANRDT